MNNDLKYIIPKKDNNNSNYIKPKPYNRNKKAIILTIMLVFFVIICVIGFVYTYNNIIKENSNNICKTKKECFLKAALNCENSNYSETIENTNLFLSLTSTDYNYTIKGFNDENKCLLEIKTIDVNISYDPDQIIEFINNKNNINKVYSQYMLLKAFQSMDVNSSDLNNLELTKANKPIIINEINNLINENRATYPKEGQSTNQLIEMTKKSLIGLIENCIINDPAKTSSFITNRMDGIIIATDVKKTFNFKNNKSMSTNNYDGIICYSEN